VVGRWVQNGKIVHCKRSGQIVFQSSSFAPVTLSVGIRAGPRSDAYRLSSAATDRRVSPTVGPTLTNVRQRRLTASCARRVGHATSVPITIDRENERGRPEAGDQKHPNVRGVYTAARTERGFRRSRKTRWKTAERP